MSDAPGAAPLLPPWRVERILFDDEGVLVVDKPAGIPMDAAEGLEAHGLTARLEEHLRALGREEPPVAHQRLESETSGAILFTTDRSRSRKVAAAIERRGIERVFVAVVGPPDGRPTVSRRLPDDKRLEVWIAHEGDQSRVFDGRPPRGDRNRDRAKRAVTHLKVLRRAGERALVELRPETGRTDQIRATLAHFGSPIVGDRAYGGSRASRLMLHVSSLQGGPLRGAIEAPLPECFEEALCGAEEFPSDVRASLGDAATLRAPLASQTGVYRLVNGAGDGLSGLTVDAYGPYALLNIYDESLLRRARELALAVQALGFVGVYVKQRVRADLRTQDADVLAPHGPLVGEAAPASFLVDELGMQIRIELDDGLSTGLFVDMRDNRFRARGWARGGRVLNLFCYTSSFSVSAALSGATTTNVDLSAKALERSRSNFEENGLDPAAHRFFKEDAMKFLARAARRGDEYDFIVLDPPSFSTVGKGTFSVKGKYGEAAADCFRLLSSGGRLLCVTNHTKTSPRAFRKTVEAACDAAGRQLLTLKELAPGLDCPSHPDGPWPSKSLLVEVR